MDFVSIVTPNHLHFPVAKAALAAGFPVVCDKPMTFTLAEAKKLAALVRSSGLLFALTHNYTGYPMVKEMRDSVRNGSLGKIRKVVVEYLQGWLVLTARSRRAKAGRLADRPGALGRLRLHGRHRHPRRKPRRVRHGPRG